MSKTGKSLQAEAKRGRRLLKLMVGKKVQLEQTFQESTILLVFAGERTVKCQRGIVANWLKAGLVEIRQQKDRRGIDIVKITDAGIAFLERSESGGYSEQHREMEHQNVGISGVKHEAMKNINESPLSMLFNRKTSKQPWLSAEQFDAGERLRSDFEFCQLTPKITASWDPTRSLNKNGGGRKPADTLTDRVLGARQRFNRALDAVGPEFSGVLLDVCCFLKGMEQVERERQWPRRSAKLLLKAALSALARHYNPQQNSRSASGIQAWAAADNRPKM